MGAIRAVEVVGAVIWVAGGAAIGITSSTVIGTTSGTAVGIASKISGAASSGERQG